VVAGRVADELGIRLDAGKRVADLVHTVFLTGVLEEVLFPAPRDFSQDKVSVGHIAVSDVRICSATLPCSNSAICRASP
jgi:hypothetical protein